jgi:hypothetical protein
MMEDLSCDGNFGCLIRAMTDKGDVMTSAFRKIVAVSAAVVGVVFASTTVEAHAASVKAPKTTVTHVVTTKSASKVAPLDWWWN